MTPERFRWPTWSLLAMAFWLGAWPVLGDEIRPAFLEIRQSSADEYAVLLKVPAKGPDQRLSLNVRLPEGSEMVDGPEVDYVGNAFIERSTIRRSGGLVGTEIAIDGLARTSTDALVRIEGLEGHSQMVRLSPAAPSMIVTAAPTSAEVAKTYTILGIEHILEGIDHLLFVLCLVMVAGFSKKLLITITGFTIAHSVTLVLSTLQIVEVPIGPVEAVIALSIVFLACEIIKNKRDGLTYRYPVTVSSSFGLLHGFGFAAVLGEIGLPEDEVPISLLFFNVGVELGQLLFIFALMVIAWLPSKCFYWIRGRDIPRAIWQPVTAYGVGIVATYWTIERVAGFY